MTPDLLTVPFWAAARVGAEVVEQPEPTVKRITLTDTVKGFITTFHLYKNINVFMASLLSGIMSMLMRR
jgi:hypothetical protein